MQKIVLTLIVVILLSGIIFGIVTRGRSHLETVSETDTAENKVSRTTLKSGDETKSNACGLLTTDEIKSIQGEPLKETKASGSVQDGLRVSQCFYSLPTFVNSINVVVTQRGDGGTAHDPKEQWEATFKEESGNSREEQRERKNVLARERKEEDEEIARPIRIAGVGDEAFWTGNRFGGALYVLRHHTFIRISVGGAGDQQTKINKSKALARFALKRV
ncbi:MAG: hypothetical protein C5B55_10650 [Blastocatellia bacterium]|nr:MAG: hypothetical protein C5B55_10650 [Blastocatellia bacterium]